VNSLAWIAGTGPDSRRRAAAGGREAADEASPDDERAAISSHPARNIGNEPTVSQSLRQFGFAPWSCVDFGYSRRDIEEVDFA